MTPPDRMVWLASHRAEPYYRLVTVAEVAILEAQLKRAVVYETEFKAVVALLDSMGYWQDKPDVRTAVADATFDARRYQRGASSAIDVLEKTIAGWSVNANNDAAFIANPAQVLALLEFLKAQSAAVREAPKETA